MLGIYILQNVNKGEREREREREGGREGGRGADGADGKEENGLLEK